MTRVLVIAFCCLVAGPSFASAPGSSRSHADPASTNPVRTAKVSLKQDLVPIFRDNCTMCHRSDSPMAGLALTPEDAYDNLVRIQASGADMPRVAPGNPERSYLYNKVSGKNAAVNGAGIAMPPGPPLSSAEIDLIRRWIKQGARNN